MYRPLCAAVLLASGGCHVLGPGDLQAWKDAHGIADSAETADTGPSLPQEPTPEPCDGAWGRIQSAMDDEDVPRTVSVGSGMALLFWFQGYTDLCAIGCTVDWVEPLYFTSNENYSIEDDWLTLPYRLSQGERVYAYFYLHPDSGQTPGDSGTCTVETSARQLSFEVQAIGA
jgi:hypothetical protein